MIGRKHHSINRMLDEHLKHKHELQRRELHQKKRAELYKIEKEDLPKDAIIIPRKNVKSFLFGAIAMVVVLTFIGGAFAVFYAGTSQIVSTVTTGTAPFSVASTTKVTNLNADLLDDLSSADLQDLPSAWTCTIRYLQSADCGASCSSQVTVPCVGSEKVITGGCLGSSDTASGEVFASAPGSGSGANTTTQSWRCDTFTTNGRSNGYVQCCT